MQISTNEIMEIIKNFKKTYIKNLLIYKIYRILKYKPFISHSAFGEEILVNRILKNKYGFYIDVGALNPKVGSLTFLLYKKGWKGINFDLTKSNINLFKFLRKRDKSVQVAISDKKSFVESYIFDSGSGLNSLNKKYADKWRKKLYKPYRIEKIRSNTLNSVIEEYNIPKDFDYLNIDVESHELKVLAGLDLKKYRPKLITIEIHCSGLEDIIKNDIYKHLRNNNYKLISYYFLTAFFIPDEDLTNLKSL